MNRRTFLGSLVALAASRSAFSYSPATDPGFRLVDVTAKAGIDFRHNSGAYGAKLLPETLGSGCAFLDYDNDGWQDILLVNGMDWPAHRRRRSTLRLYRNNRNGTFTDVTRQAGLDIEMYGMGVAVGDYNNDGSPDILVTCVGQNRLFRNTGKGTFVDVTRTSGLGNRLGFSTSALWFDFDRDGLLDLFVCNYVKWSPETDVFCSLDGKTKSYCTPEAYRGQTCWLFHNRGDGTFEDVTAKSGLFDASSKSLGVAMLDFDNDGWPDLFVANDTQPNKLYRNLRNGSFREVGVETGIAFSAEGKARAGMGVDAADLDNSSRVSIVVTNFESEMIGLYQASKGGEFNDVAIASGIGTASKNTLGFGCLFLDADLDGFLDLAAVNGHIDDTVRNIRRGVNYEQPPQLFLNDGKGHFRDVARDIGAGFAAPRVGRGLAYGDFDGDGDLDLLITTNNGPAYLFRNDQSAGNRSIRFRLVGTKSNRDAIGARVRLHHNDGGNRQHWLRVTLKGTKSNRSAIGATVTVTLAGGAKRSAMVKTGSSYLSQSELPVTFGVGRRDKIERVVIDWPSGATEEHKGVATGQAYECVEGKGLQPMRR